jgi:hypothetical protein
MRTCGPVAGGHFVCRITEGARGLDPAHEKPCSEGEDRGKRSTRGDDNRVGQTNLRRQRPSEQGPKDGECRRKQEWAEGPSIGGTRHDGWDCYSGAGKAEGSELNSNDEIRNSNECSEIRMNVQMTNDQMSKQIQSPVLRFVIRILNIRH